MEAHSQLGKAGGTGRAEGPFTLSSLSGTLLIFYVLHCLALSPSKHFEQEVWLKVCSTFNSEKRLYLLQPLPSPLEILEYEWPKEVHRLSAGKPESSEYQRTSPCWVLSMTPYSTTYSLLTCFKGHVEGKKVH